MYSVSVSIVDTLVWRVESEDDRAGVVGEVNSADKDVGDSRMAVILESARDGLSGLLVGGVVRVGDVFKLVIDVGDNDPKVGTVEPFTAPVSETIVVRVVPSITTVVVNRAQFGGVRIPDAAEPDNIEVTVVPLVEIVSDSNTPVAGEEGEVKGDDQTVAVELPDGGGQRVEAEAELSKLWSVVIVLESRSVPVLGSGLGLGTSPEVVGVAAEESHALLLIRLPHVDEPERSTLVLDVRSPIGEDPAVLGVTENDQSEGVPVSRPFVGVLVLIEVLVPFSIDDALSKGS
ncbi:unnamed protein product [Clonostachys solani]|uniref:Uncharacterized protein n=1 Tax=Clonostachys solani TaxID=160281 RepID=A0A9N9VWW4_9HYPO|nr:unnamed protein product [Clonostachys solani]